MNDASPAPRRTVTLRTSSGKPVLTLPVVPAAAAAAAALALAPRLTALAALAALLRKMSLSLGAATPVEPPAL
jgi:hypothetical protein